METVSNSLVPAALVFLTGVCLGGILVEDKIFKFGCASIGCYKCDAIQQVSFGCTKFDVLAADSIQCSTFGATVEMRFNK